jgi:hypothetical protein
MLIGKLVIFINIISKNDIIGIPTQELKENVPEILPYLEKLKCKFLFIFFIYRWSTCTL